MYTGKLIFSQLMDHLPMHSFRRYVTRYQGERYVKRHGVLDQYVVMAFTQLSESGSKLMAIDNHFNYFSR